MARRRKPGRPVGTTMSPELRRVMISIRIDPELLATIREMAEARGVGYQSLMHEWLSSAAARRGGAHAVRTR